MVQGEKSAYTDKQKRRAKHKEESREKQGTPNEEAERTAWATVNLEDGGKKSGSGRKRVTLHESGKREETGDGKAASADKRSNSPSKTGEHRRKRAA